MRFQNILWEIPAINSPVGEPAEESKLYITIDEQVMKFGSLQHDTINWQLLIDSATQYLAEVCKDYKVLQYLAYALLQQNTKVNLADFLALFVEFNEKYLFIAYPKPSQDKSVNRFKNRSIALILNRLEDAVLNRMEELSGEQNRIIQDLVKRLSKQLSDYVTESAVIFNKVLRTLESERTQSSVIQKPDIAQVPSVVHSSALMVQNIPAEKINILDAASFDLSNERKLKQFYLQVADTTCELEPSSTLGYISRRYGLWRNISQLPEMNAEGVTSMQSVAIDKLIDYRAAVMNTPDIALLTRIEKTVVSSPYWIEGSYLAAQCCRALKFYEAAEAIHSETKRFVDKHKNFIIARFQNSDPFLPAGVLDWLSNRDNITGLSNTMLITNNFDEIYQSQGFIAVLKAIDEMLTQLVDIRTRSYLQLDKINYFIAEGITNIALNELDELLENSRKYAIEQWDSNFFEQINQLKNQLIQGVK